MPPRPRRHLAHEGNHEPLTRWRSWQARPRSARRPPWPRAESSSRTGHREKTSGPRHSLARRAPHRRRSGRASRSWPSHRACPAGRAFCVRGTGRLQARRPTSRIRRSFPQTLFVRRRRLETDAPDRGLRTPSPGFLGRPRNIRAAPPRRGAAGATAARPRGPTAAPLRRTDLPYATSRAGRPRVGARPHEP